MFVVGGFVAYAVVRALTRSGEAKATSNALRIRNWESTLGIDWEHRLQSWVLEHDRLTSWFSVAYVWLYWPILIVTFAFTYLRRPAMYRAYRNALLWSGAVGAVVFAAFPVAPPRFFDEFIDTVDQAQRDHFVGHPEFIINRYAAMPSFHAGWIALSCVVLAKCVRSRLVRSALVLPPALMCVAVIVTANHFVLDVVVGVGLSVAALAISVRRGRGMNNRTGSGSRAGVASEPTKRPACEPSMEDLAT